MKKWVTERFKDAENKNGEFQSNTNGNTKISMHVQNRFKSFHKYGWAYSNEQSAAWH